MNDRRRSKIVRSPAIHWEGDLIDGSRNSYERHSRYAMLVKVGNKDPESVVSALIKQNPSDCLASFTRR